MKDKEKNYDIEKKQKLMEGKKHGRWNMEGKQLPEEMGRS